MGSWVVLISTDVDSLAGALGLDFRSRMGRHRNQRLPGLESLGRPHVGTSGRAEGCQYPGSVQDVSSDTDRISHLPRISASDVRNRKELLQDKEKMEQHAAKSREWVQQGMKEDAEKHSKAK